MQTETLTPIDGQILRTFTQAEADAMRDAGHVMARVDQPGPVRFVIVGFDYARAAANAREVATW